MIQANKDRYVAVSKLTGIPWSFIAVIHNMEASLNFKSHLHNGDPLTARTVQVPAGYPKKGNPPFKWEDSAADANLVVRIESLQRWLNTFPGIFVKIDGTPGNLTSEAFRKVTGVYLPGDPRR